MIGNFISAYKPSNIKCKYDCQKDNEVSEQVRAIATVNLIIKAFGAFSLPIILLSLLSTCGLGLSGRASLFETAKNLAIDGSILVIIHEVVVIADNVFSRKAMPGGVAQQGLSALANSFSGLWNGTERAEQNYQRDNLKAYTQDTLIAKHLVRLF